MAQRRSQQRYTSLAGAAFAKECGARPTSAMYRVRACIAPTSYARTWSWLRSKPKETSQQVYLRLALPSYARHADATGSDALTRQGALVELVKPDFRTPQKITSSRDLSSMHE